MPLLNIRISASERIKLKALAQTGGYTNVSAFVRHQLGLRETALTDGDVVPDKDVIDLEHILPYMSKIHDLQEHTYRGVKRIAKSLGLDTEASVGPVEKKVQQDGFERT